MNKGVSRLLVVFVIIQAAAIIWLIVDRLQQKKENTKLEAKIVETDSEKEAVEKELNDLLAQYNEIKTDNAQINSELEEKKAEIEKLIKEVKSVRRGNRAKIKELEEEAETLRSIMQDYVRQIADLNTKNKELTKENKEIKKQYETVTTEKDELSTLKDSLTKKVEKAAVLNTYGIKVLPLTRRDNETSRARKTTKYKVCFVIGENSVARKGRRTIYMRIADPENQILMNTTSGMFMYQNKKQIAYSSKIEIDYDGNPKELCIYWTSEGQKQAEGRYTVHLFAEGDDIGETTFHLK